MKKTLMVAAVAAFMMSGFVATEAVAGPEGKCKACHNFTMKDKVGPHLKGVFGREAGKSGFKKHSKALKNANWTWNEENLLKWVCNSKNAIKELTGDPKARTKMPPQKMCGEKGKAVVAFLKTL
ncbi:MAG: cytochrome C [Proteobacteria bacterium]|nr:c-type cytochrome [bacterium AH-315-G11]PCI42539.1 MAG: cytochrome C [Pseudomonadota bacterium]